MSLLTQETQACVYREGSVIPHVFYCVFRHGGHRLHGRQILTGGSVDKIGGRRGRGGRISGSCNARIIINMYAFNNPVKLKLNLI